MIATISFRVPCARSLIVCCALRGWVHEAFQTPGSRGPAFGNGTSNREKWRRAERYGLDPSAAARVAGPTSADTTSMPAPSRWGYDSPRCPLSGMSIDRCGSNWSLYGSPRSMADGLLGNAVRDRTLTARVRPQAGARGRSLWAPSESWLPSRWPRPFQLEEATIRKIG